MTAFPRISAIAVTEPDTSLSQRDVLVLLGLEGDEFAERVFHRSAVATRSLELSRMAPNSTLQGRTQLTEDHLFGYAVAAIERLDVDPAEIGTIVTSSLYSLGGPTLAHRLLEHFKMGPSTDKYHVVGVGCASAVPLVRLVSAALDTHPGKKGLIVAAESMTGLLMRAGPDDERAKTIGSAIFGDGCGAMLIDRGERGPAIVASRMHQIEGTLDVVRMELTDDDSYLHLDRDLPEVAATGLPELVDDFLGSVELERGDIDHWIVHPGGRRILDRVAESLELTRAQLETSYDVLASRGNVGTPSIFYVLSETLQVKTPAPGERGLMVTVGPGVTVGLMLLEF